VVSLIGAFYIPRLLGAKDYGIYQSAIAFIGFFLFFTFNGLNKVIIREASKDLTQTKTIIESFLGIKFLTSIIGIILCLIVLVFINYAYATKIYIAVLSMSLLVLSFDNTVNSIYLANEKMKIFGILKFAKTIFFVSACIILLKFGYGILSLVVIKLAVDVFMAVFNYLYSRKFLHFNFLLRPVFIKEYIIQGWHFSILTQLNYFSSKFDIVMLSFLTTPENVGIYAFAQRILEKSTILRDSIQKSMYPNYVKKLKNNKLKYKLLIRHSMHLFIPGLLVVVFIILVSKPIIIKLVGIEYIDSAHVLNVLAFFMLFSFIGVPFSTQLQVNYNEKILVYIGLVRAILNITLNLLLFSAFGLIGIAYSTLGTAFVGTVMIMLLSYIRRPLNIETHKI
jgi:polysaccharide transporter, PST family